MRVVLASMGFTFGITFGIESIKYQGILLWNRIPDLIKRTSSASIFRRNMEHLNGEEGNCKICR